jgi:trimeric autotransporter adhesin
MGRFRQSRRAGFTLKNAMVETERTARSHSSLFSPAIICFAVLLSYQNGLAQTAGQASDEHTIKAVPSMYKPQGDLPDGRHNCKQLYDPEIWQLNEDAQNQKDIVLGIKTGSIALDGVANTLTLTADIAKVVAEASESAGNAAAAPGTAVPGGDAPGHIAASIAEAIVSATSGIKVAAGSIKEVKIGLDAVAQGYEYSIQDLNKDAQNLKEIQIFGGLPNCGTTYNGSIVSTVPKGEAGLILKESDLYVGGEATVEGDVEVKGNVTATQVTATQGIAAHNGAIILGNPDMETYQEGITIGGGSISGAGIGGALAYTGHFSAIAIGNGAEAWNVNSLAFGAGAKAEAANTTAVGAGSRVAKEAGPGSFAGGQSMVSKGTGAVSLGYRSESAGDGATSLGAYSYALGNGAVSLGHDNVSYGEAAISAGHRSLAAGDGTVALGWGAKVTARNGMAMGTGATVTGEDSMAYGAGAQALGIRSTAMGQGTYVAAGTYGSSAIGAGAVATLSQQMMLGTANTTYTAPGINSNLSRSRQSGPLGVVTSDAFGNLASDNGALYSDVAVVKSAAAVAMSLKSPTLKNHEKFAMQLSWGGFDGANAVGFSTVGQLATEILVPNDRLSISAGVGWGQATVSGYTEDAVGGNAGVQWSW